jgi:hypothetical protein
MVTIRMIILPTKTPYLDHLSRPFRGVVWWGEVDSAWFLTRFRQHVVLGLYWHLDSYIASRRESEGRSPHP